MNECVAMLLDANLADHWPDLLMAALLATLGWLVTTRLNAMDARHDKAEKKFDEVDACTGDLKLRVTKMETVAEERERARQAREERR